MPTAVPRPLCSWGPQASSHHPFLSPSSTQSIDLPPRPLPPPLTSQGQVRQPPLAPPMVTEVFPHVSRHPELLNLHSLGAKCITCSPCSFLLSVLPHSHPSYQNALQTHLPFVATLLTNLPPG